MVLMINSYRMPLLQTWGFGEWYKSAAHCPHPHPSLQLQNQHQRLGVKLSEVKGDWVRWLRMNKGLGKRVDKRLREREREKERSFLAPWRTAKITKSSRPSELRLQSTKEPTGEVRALRENEVNYIEPWVEPIVSVPMCTSKGIRVEPEGLTMGLLHQPRTPPAGAPWGLREREEVPTDKDGRA